MTPPVGEQRNLLLRRPARPLKGLWLIALRNPVESIPINPEAATRWTAKHRLGCQVYFFGIDHPLEPIELGIRKDLPLKFVRDGAACLDDRAAKAANLRHYGITTIWPTRAPVPAILAWMLAS